jgi:hypothetical protein
MRKEIRQIIPRINRNPALPASFISPMSQEMISTISDTGNLNKSLEKVYERYGSDLHAFFQDAYESVNTKRESDD